MIPSKNTIYMVLHKTLNSVSKSILIVLITAVTLTSIKIQSASAFELLPPSPMFSTATQILYDAMQERAFTIPEKPVEQPKPVVMSVPEVKYARTYTVTAYNSVPWQTDSTPCISADGSNICQLREQGEQSCAAALPFGTKIHVPGFGVCTVRDRLATKYSHRVDLYFGGVDQIPAAKSWGKRQVVVEVLNKEI